MPGTLTEIADHLYLVIEGKIKVHPDYIDQIAEAMKKWAVSQGATHFCHWFQPLRGRTAEKHDAFIDWNGPDEVIEKFSGKTLLQGEPDASSFPSGGLRTTFEARGYTSWDPTSPAFLWKGVEGMTLCIPSFYFSWRGHILDSKIPMLLSEQKLEKSVLRLLSLSGVEAKTARCTLGFEQEFFIIDQEHLYQRPDLLLSGRTLFGAQSPKGQELQDHYFGSIADRVLVFMQEVEQESIELGIPVKTRHNEVAPAQYEFACVYELGSVALDHNLLLMALMEKIAARHGLACLLHEKPFAGLNGSGKHCNWSLVTDTGINLLDPTSFPERELYFIILLVAICFGVHRHTAVMRASIGSLGNDHRLGGHEAPPAIISIYLGSQLEELLDNIEAKGSHVSEENHKKMDLGLLSFPEIPKHTTDRNRTSPIAFTGDKFEFRAIGSQANPSLPVTVINAIISESLNMILDEIEENSAGQNRADVALDVVRKYLKQSRNIRYSGDNYSEQWTLEAKRRKLPNIKETPIALDSLVSSEATRLFDGILSPHELQSLYQVHLENYVNTAHIEINLILDLFRTSILPAALSYQKELAKTLSLTAAVLKEQGSLEKLRDQLGQLSEQINLGLELYDDLKEKKEDILKKPLQTQPTQMAIVALPLMQKLRLVIDQLEKTVDDRKWPFPKYRELLFQL